MGSQRVSANTLQVLWGLSALNKWKWSEGPREFQSTWHRKWPHQRLVIFFYYLVARQKIWWSCLLSVVSSWRADDKKRLPVLSEKRSQLKVSQAESHSVIREFIDFSYSHIRNNEQDSLVLTLAVYWVMRKVWLLYVLHQITSCY